MNSVNLVGRLSREPFLRYNDDGILSARYTLAIQDDYSKEKPDYVNCIAFRKTAEIVRDLFKKGMQVEVSGKIQSGSYPDKETGEKIYYQRVLVLHNRYCSSGSGVKPSIDEKEDDRILPINNEYSPEHKETNEEPVNKKPEIPQAEELEEFDDEELE